MGRAWTFMKHLQRSGNNGGERRHKGRQDNMILLSSPLSASSLSRPLFASSQVKMRGTSSSESMAEDDGLRPALFAVNLQVLVLLPCATAAKQVHGLLCQPRDACSSSALPASYQVALSFVPSAEGSRALSIKPKIKTPIRRHATREWGSSSHWLSDVVCFVCQRRKFTRIRWSTTNRDTPVSLQQHHCAQRDFSW